MHSFAPIDFVEIKRVVNNLIANASEYSPLGGRIVLRLFETKNEICLSVQDFGKGMNLTEQKDIFSHYISYAKKYKKVGSGLGLYITKKIIDAHNGKIKVDSKPNHGTTITILLPKEVTNKNILLKKGQFFYQFCFYIIYKELVCSISFKLN